MTRGSRRTAGLPGVVLLHGVARTPRSLRRMERALQGCGFATLNLAYPSRKQALESLAEFIHPAVTRFADSVDDIHFVTHSMGGLLAQLYLASHRPARLRHVVMLGPPNSCSEVADLLKNRGLYRAFYGLAGQQLGTVRPPLLSRLPLPDYPLGILAGSRTIDPVSSFLVIPRPNDGKVSVASTRLEGMTDHLVIRATHSGLLTHQGAIEQTIAFLRDGRFRREP